MGKLKRGAFFTDIHFGKKANSQLHNEDCIKYLKWFSEQVKQYQCDYVGFLGDWNENRSALNIHTLNYAHTGARILNDIGVPVYFVIGNHDLYYRNSREIHSVIHHAVFENITLIEQPTIIKEIKGDVLFCPYLFHEEYPSLMQYLTVPFWAGHFEFRDFVITGYDITMPTGPDAADFKGPKYIASGHFHKRQSKPNLNVVYIGNTFPMDFGDAGDTDRGMMIYDHDKDKMGFIDWPDCPHYVKTKLSCLIDEEISLDNILTPNSRVNCIIDVPLEFEEVNVLKQQLIKEFSLRDLNFEESPEIRKALTETDSAIDWETTSLQGVDECVHIMLDTIDTEHYDKNLLIELYKQLRLSTE